MGGASGEVVHNYQRVTKEYKYMMIGKLMPKTLIVLDEFKIYNRMLSEKEISKKYISLFPLHMKASPIIFHEGKASSITISLKMLPAICMPAPAIPAPPSFCAIF